MTSDDQNIPSDDFDDLIAQSEAEWPSDPSPRATIISIPRIKFMLRDFIREMTPVRDELRELDPRSERKLCAGSYQALASVTSGLRFPPDDTDHPVYQIRLREASERKLDRHAIDAFVEVDAIIDIAEKALASIHLLDQFNQRLPDSWGNLPPNYLAREINAYAFAVFGSAVV